MRRWLAAAVLSLALVPLARAESFLNQKAPDLGALEHVSGDRIADLSQLKGKLVLLEFFTTW